MRILRKRRKKERNSSLRKISWSSKQIIIKRDGFSFGEFLAHRIVINHPLQFSRAHNTHKTKLPTYISRLLFSKKISSCLQHGYFCTTCSGIIIMINCFLINRFMVNIFIFTKKNLEEAFELVIIFT